MTWLLALAAILAAPTLLAHTPRAQRAAKDTAMTAHYTAADHFTAAEVILANFNPPDEKHGSWWINPAVSAAAVLDAVAPAIAARALRGHADELIAAVAQFPETSWERHNNEATADLARRRADEVEAGQS